MNMINKIYNEDCQEGIKRIPNASVDCILTDPPYLYLKGQKLERPFDEHALFTEFKRVLKPTGFVVLFGRGTSFYRWNTRLADLGFLFKEEVIWDKQYTSSPVLPLSRKHESVSIHTVNGAINRNYVPYIEAKNYDISSICADIKRLSSIFNNVLELEKVHDFLLNGRLYSGDVRSTSSTTVGANSTRKACVPVNVMKMIKKGQLEKSIISIPHDRYVRIHPTQKPVRLLERLLALTTKPGDVVLDPFSGSCSTAVACINTNRKYIGFEIDKEYYDAGIHRINETLKDLKLVV